MTTLIAEVKKTLKLAWPIMFGLIGQHLFGLLDTIMVGHHSTVELAAAAFANNVVNMPMVFMYGFSSSISVRVAHASGRGDNSAAGAILRHGLVWLSAFGAASYFAIETTNLHLDLFGQSPDVVNAAHTFLTLMALSLIPQCAFMAFRQFSEGLGYTMAPNFIVAIGFALNTMLNVFLIFGRYGFPEMGLAGAGLATLISRSVMLVLIMLFIFFRSTYRPYLTTFWSKKFHSRTFMSLFRLGALSGAQYIFEVGVFAISALMMGWLGTNTLAAHQVTINVASITFMVPLSLSIATSIQVGRAYGKQNWPECRTIASSTATLTTGIACFLAAIFILGRFAIPKLFTTDLEVLSIASQIFIFAGFFQVFDGLQTVYLGCLRGIDDAKVPALIAFISYWACGFTIAYIFAFPFGMKHNGIWLGLSVSLVIAAVLLRRRFYSRVQRLRNN